MSLQPPFALFVTAENIDVDYINDSLTRAWKGNFEAGWELWVATDNYDDAPKNRDDNELPEGSKAPLPPESVLLPFAGKTLHDCARWLRNAPSAVAVHKEYFVAMDEHSQGDDTMMTCRIIKLKLQGNVELQYFPQPIDTVVMEMATNGGTKFNEKAQNYQRSRLMDGRPDRSKAGPYQ